MTKKVLLLLALCAAAITLAINTFDLPFIPSSYDVTDTDTFYLKSHRIPSVSVKTLSDTLQARTTIEQNRTSIEQTIEQVAVYNMTTITVSSTDELMSALSNASGGDTILLSGGEYGLGLYGPKVPFAQQYDSQVTIASANPEDPAVFTSLYLREVSNIALDGIIFDYTASEDMSERDIAFTIRDASGITITNSTFDGYLAHDTGTGADGLGTGIGLGIRNAADITLEGNEFYNFHRAITFGTVDNIIVRGNDIHDIRSDGMDFAQVTNVLIEDNYIHDFRSSGDPGDHRDMIQFWTNGTNQPSTDIIIRNNVLDSGEGDHTQSIFMRNERVDSYGDGLEMYYQNVTIENNVIYNASTHGIMVGETNGLTITNNTLLQNVDIGSQVAVTQPSINLKTGSLNVTVTNNIVPRLGLEDVGDEFTVENNLVVQNSDPTQPNYVGDLFVNALAGADAELFDLQALPNGLIEQLGVGAALTAYNSHIAEGSSIVGHITADVGTGKNLSTRSFDVSDLTGSDGELDMTNAKVHWDFGDGSSSDNISPSHNYADAGQYVVQATVELGSGETVTLSKTIDVTSPIVVMADFNGSASADSNLSNAANLNVETELADETYFNGATASDQVTVETLSDGNSAIRLNGGTVNYGRNTDFANNPEYTVLIDFKKDAPDSGGRLIYFGSFVFALGTTDMQIGVNSTTNSTYLKPRSLAIDDTDWHKLAFTFSGIDGSAVLYLDGEEIARSNDFADSIQAFGGKQDLKIGDPWGKSNFDGLIDNFAFVRWAMTAEEISNGFDSLHAVTEEVQDEFTPDEPVDDAIVDGDDIISDPIVDVIEPEEIVPTTLNGTHGNDRLTGTDGVDIIDGIDGKDRIYAGAGDDIVHMGNGNWGMADGGEGNDTIFGGDGADTIFGRDGDDYIDGGAQMDKLFGGAGNDTLIGGSGRDYLYGEAGNDILRASDQEYNTLDGGEGNDQLFGGASRDYLFGGDGNDILRGGGGKDDLTGGEGADQFILDALCQGDSVLDFNALEDMLVFEGLAYASTQDVKDAAFEHKGSLYINLEGVGTDFSWSGNYVKLVGVNLEDLNDSNVILAA